MSSFDSLGSMSTSPPIRRLSTSSASKREEELINAFEAEEERIINILSRKLEQLREEKISIERQHEEESEAHVNRLARELAALRIRQQQSAQAQVNGDSTSVSTSPTLFTGSLGAVDPSTEVLLAALKKENETLRSRLVTAERDFIRVTRLNEIYREELIELRRRLGQPVDNLIGMSTSAQDPYSQPLHRRQSSTASSSPTASMVALPTLSSRTTTTHSVPIPRLPSQVHRPHKQSMAIPETPLSHSPSSSGSPLVFSPIMSLNPESYMSGRTDATTPPSSASLQSTVPAPYPHPPPNTLSYPSVPPPSLSSSLGSPTVAYYLPSRDPPSPAEPFSLSRQPSQSLSSRRFSNDRRVAETGNLRELSHSRRASVERGARIAETGSLVRSRAGSSASTPAIQPADQSPVIGAYVPSLNDTLE